MSTKRIKKFRAILGLVTAVFSLYIAVENLRKLHKGTHVVVEE